MTLCLVETEAGDVTLTLRGRLPRPAIRDRPGLLVRRRPGWGPAALAAELGVPSAEQVVGCADRAAFVGVRSDDLARVAVDLARLGHVRLVVVCPEGSSPGRVALALAVADRLRAQRPAQIPVVTSARLLPLGAQLTAVPHEVRCDTGSGAEDRVVWEILGADQLTAWLTGLRRAGEVPRAA
jgi:hypothetical protein